MDKFHGRFKKLKNKLGQEICKKQFVSFLMSYKCQLQHMAGPLEQISYFGNLARAKVERLTLGATRF